ncbi:hypothetical protein D3Z52_11835 [Clostridiaceae bacterium]|nr:hypothetical protein [Clostridiaceae bacterium]
MKLHLLGESVVISPDREHYNTYRLMFQKDAEQALQSFRILYQKNTSLEMAVRNLPDQIYQSMKPAIDQCIQILIDHQILTMDETRFMNMYPETLDAANDAYLTLQDQYAEIVLNEKEKDAYRSARRAGRGRWSGGGFGLSGAVKGAMTAGALNMVTGAGHMLFNGVAQIGSSLAASAKMNKIFQNKATAAMLEEGIFRSVCSLHMALIDCLAQMETDTLAIEGAVSPEDKEAAASIVKNIPQIRDIEQRRMAMIQAFQLDPYQEAWYRVALQAFGDQDGSLENAEKHFGMSVIHHEKGRQLDEFARSLPLDTEAQAKSAAAKIEEERQRLNYTAETEQTKKIQAAVERFDTEYRTVDGMLLPTREEADAARLELKRVHEIEQGINYDDLSSIADGEQKMTVLTSKPATAHRETLHRKWNELDRQLRTVAPLPDGSSFLCETPQQAQQLRPLVQQLSQRLEDCGKDASAEIPLFQLKEDVNAESLPPSVADSYRSEIDNRLTAIDLELRTTLGKEYSSREAARAAEQLYQQIRADFAAGNPRQDSALFRHRIEDADFSDEAKSELLNELFQYENAKELQTAKVFSTFSSIALLAIVIASYFFPLSGTAAFAQKDVTVKGVSLMLTDVHVTDSLTFVNGLINGLVVFGRCIGDIFVNGFFEYVRGFDFGLIGNILWAVLGLLWLPIKHIIIGIVRYLVSLIVTFFQDASFRYYLGYIIGTAVPFAVSQLSFDEDKQEENVKRIRGWTAKKSC